MDQLGWSWLFQKVKQLYNTPIIEIGGSSKYLHIPPNFVKKYGLYKGRESSVVFFESKEDLVDFAQRCPDLDVVMVVVFEGRSEGSQ
jgi:hypothetical protein